MEICTLREQKVFAVQKFGSQKQLLNSFVPVQGKSDEKKRV